MAANRVNRTVLIYEEENYAAAVESFSTALGLDFGEGVARADLGLQAVVGWDIGLEIVAPLGHDGMAQALRDHLRDKGEGFFCLVVEVDDLDGAERRMTAHGASRLGDRLDCLAVNPAWTGRFRSALEAVMTPVQGVGVTLIALDPR